MYKLKFILNHIFEDLLMGSFYIHTCNPCEIVSIKQGCEKPWQLNVFAKKK